MQTFVAKKAATYLSQELNTTVSLSGIYIKPFKSVVIEGLLVLDKQNDTLLNTPKLLVDLNQFSLKKRIIDVSSIQLNDGAFFLKSYKNGSTNLDFILNYFKSGAEPSVKKKKKPFELTFNRIIINNLRFKYKNQKIDTVIKGVNFDDIYLSGFNGIFEGLNTSEHILQTNIKNLTFKEKSGFFLKNLSALTTVDTNQIELKKLLLITNQSRLTDYFQMSFEKFGDFKDYFNKVRMKANFKDSRLAAKDIAYFTSALEGMNLNIDIDGQISGLVNNLRAKQLSVRAGKATYIKGDFNVRGLPNLKETFMDLKIDMAGSNKKDLDELLTSTTGKKAKGIPEIISKFGNFNFNGTFTGFQNDFIAYGEFKTKLGRVVSDVNMKIDKAGVPSYSGYVKTYDFNIGQLLNEKSLGRVTSAVNIKGRGTEINNLTENIDGDIRYIDFNNYRYQNVSVNGIFAKKRFDGNLKINDKNVQLVFSGGVNLNPDLPVFNFHATIRNAKLKALKLTQDSMKIDADFNTNFSGDNLNNIQGDLYIGNIQLNNAKGIYDIDSVQLTARGIGIDRDLTIQSDVLDASIKGQYDLNTLPSYYKHLAKTYIPSLKTEIVKYGTQNFQFNLVIKKFAPISELLVPGLEIEDQAILVGNFDSRNRVATLNGFVKKLSYRGLTVNNIIIDENTTNTQLHAIITSDRVDLNDSLLVKNVNISNILRNDSLLLNIKLSDADDVNQLDLNGLVEFATNNTARISILPSLLTINNEEWAIQEKVQINFNQGKTQIDNFDLSNGKQKLTIDGLISDDPADLLQVGFEDFQLKTLNPFMKGFGVKLAGNLNGKTGIYSILKSVRIKDDIRIDSLNFNDTYIGSLTDTSSFDKLHNTANIYTRILANDQETLRLDGALDLKEKLIDVTVRLDDSKLAILAPFVKKLVSNLQGSISSDLRIHGPFDKPRINGTLALDKAQLTVNYLQTTYTITDEVSVDNSVIHIEDLKLLDKDGNVATGNGTVDLNNISYPDLNVVVNALDFMALNTTSKDNPMYYGQAYATGTFIFRGPTNKMFIGIDAKTEKGTVFNLPLNSSETVMSKDFITFVSKDTTQFVKKQTSFDGLTMSFKLGVDANSTANIFTTLGKLSGRGDGDLSLEINSFGDFEMTGDYIIESGSFDFTAQEVINKKFTIRQGGSIRWTGNPSAAQIQLKAIYSLRANLDALYKAANRSETSNNSMERVLTEVEMGLTGLLLKPDIKLDIFFPSNPAIKDELQAYFNDPNNLNLQAFSLIIRRSFAPGNGEEDLGQQLTSGVTSTATELLFNQFNNVLSSLNLDFVDINIRSFSEANASFKFFNDRIVLNAGIVDRQSTNDLSIGFGKSNVGGEVELLALLKKDGTLIGKLANKPPTQQSIFINSGINQNNNVTSVGLIYSQQFDNFRELLQKISGKYKRDQRKKQAALEAKRREEEEAEKAKQLRVNEAVLSDKRNKKKDT
ncbi:translocation/assembly module TamB domain-containing protein [Pedobacter immunditicola]|uniref:translocation/assembly module TamB domain-containing protein n=1 Tax=Pedobacter immunditicola TaxID=3133440 RepID=UPI00309D699A